MACDDCHQAATIEGGSRYSIHDHMFDFSQPQVACGECHETGDERLKKTPAHQWNIQPVKFPKPLTLAENCVRCHNDKPAEWLAENLKKISKRL